MRCPWSDTVLPADRFDGNGVLWGTCAECDKRWVFGEPVKADQPNGVWKVVEHRARVVERRAVA